MFSSALPHFVFFTLPFYLCRYTYQLLYSRKCVWPSEIDLCFCVTEFVTMGSVSSEEGSERCGSYSPSADISESESSSSFCGRRFDAEGASSSANLSPRPLASHFNFPPPQVMLPVIGGKDVVVWDRKPDLDLSGTHSFFSCVQLEKLLYFTFSI